MSIDRGAFVTQIIGILQRFLAQNGAIVPDEVVLEGVAERLFRLLIERGLPRPLNSGELGEPGGMADEECATLVARVVENTADPSLIDAMRQLVKACFYPEFKTCRNSFKEVGPDGRCRRQELARVLRRVSGTHCVDCPHWVALTPPQHERFLARQWRAGEKEFTANQAVYLPEDFRRFRRWLHATARTS
jgi:hypothetical protein